jgi:hypothetical protein
LHKIDAFTSADAKREPDKQHRHKMGKQPRWMGTEDVASCLAYLRVSEDPIVGSNQTAATLEDRVGAEFERLVPTSLEVAAREVWLARSGQSVVRRFKLIKAASRAFKSKRRTNIAARITGATEADEYRVGLMLYNGKGSLEDAYDAIGNKDRDNGPPFPFEEARLWLEEKGFFQHTKLDRRVDVIASATASASENLENLEGNEAPEDVPNEIGGASEMRVAPLARNRPNDASWTLRTIQNLLELSL